MDIDRKPVSWKLSTPSLGITYARSKCRCSCHEKVFQLPLSGSRDHNSSSELISPALFAFNSLSRDHRLVIHAIISLIHYRLSTPSLGITNEEVTPRDVVAEDAFNSLSRDHSSCWRGMGGQASYVFQLPLSGSRQSGRLIEKVGFKGSFNSLSRDHSRC